MRKEAPRVGEKIGTSQGEHGNPDFGYEIIPQNIDRALENLKMDHSSFDYLGAKPQSTDYLGWLKHSLANKWPVVAVVLCKGDPH